MDSFLPLSVHEINNPVFLNRPRAQLGVKEKFPEDLRSRSRIRDSQVVRLSRKNLIRSITAPRPSTVLYYRGQGEEEGRDFAEIEIEPTDIEKIDLSRVWEGREGEGREG